MIPPKTSKKKVVRSESKSKINDITKLSELIENLQELHRWQGRLLQEICQQTQAFTATFKKAGKSK